jgi:hypothetical protein
MTRSRVSRAILASFVCLGSTVGCGGEAPVTQVPAVASKPPPPPPPLDVSAVPAPGGLLVSGALARPSASLGRIKTWVPVPLPQSEQATELLLGEAAGAIVDLDQPVHFAAALGSAPKGGGGALGALEGGVLFAVSAAVQNVDAAKSALSEHYKIVPGPNGTFFLSGQAAPKPPSDSDDEDEDGSQETKRACELAPAFGAAPYRLVCAYGNDKALNELGPWLTRGATRQAVTSDLHVDLRMDPVHGFLEGDGKALIDLAVGFLAASLPLPSLRDLTSSLLHDAADFMLDTDGESFDVVLGDAGIHVGATLSLPRTSSTMARVITSGADRNGPPPADFWQLPADATIAGFTRGLDGSLLAHGRELVFKVIDDGLAQATVPAADRHAVTDALDKVVSFSPATFAAGIDADVASKVAAALTPPPETAAAAPEPPNPWSSASQLFGWQVFDVHRPAEEFTGAVKAFAAAWNRPALAAAYRAKLKGAAFPSLRTVTMPKGKAWAKGAAQYVFEVAAPKATAPKGAKAKAPLKPFALHALVVPDGDHVWVSIAGDEATAVAKLAAASGGGDSLKGRAELAPLQSATVGTAGFFTIRSFFSEFALAGALFDGMLHDVTEPLREIEQLPQHGTTPWRITSTASSPVPPSSVTIALDVPRGAIDDVTSLVLHHGGF